MSTTSSGLASVSTAIITDFALRLGPSVRRDDASLLRLSQRVTTECVVAMMLSTFVV
jgi:hypothetical protein